MSPSRSRSRRPPADRRAGASTPAPRAPWRRARCSASAISSLTLGGIGPDGAAVEELADGPVGVVTQDLDPDQGPREGDLDLGVRDDRRSIELAPCGRAHRAVDPGAQLHLARQCRGAAFVPKGVHRDLPSVAELAEEVLLGHDHVVQEELTELGVAGDLRHRPHLDAGGPHVDDQHRDAAVPGDRLVRARQDPAPAGVLPPRDPGLLSAQDEVVVLLDRARAQRGEVRTGFGLGEALTPDLLRREDRRDVASALLVGAEAQQRRAEHVEADDVDELRGPCRGELLVDDDLLDRRAAAPTELLGPGAADVAGVVAARLPAAQHLHAVVQRPWKVGRSQSIPREERPDLLLQRAFCGRRLELHEVTSYQFRYRLARICPSVLRFSLRLTNLTLIHFTQSCRRRETR